MKVICVTTQKDAEKLKASNAKDAAEKAEKRAEMVTKKFEKVKRKADSDIRSVIEAKIQKSTELSDATAECSNLKQLLIDAQEERDAALKYASGCDDVKSRCDDISTIFCKGEDVTERRKDTVFCEAHTAHPGVYC